MHPPPTHRPNRYYIQQYSSAAVCTALHLVRGEQLVGWFLRTLYETGNRRGKLQILTIVGHLGERASRHPPPTHHPPSTHGPTQYSSTAMQQYVEQYTGQASSSRFVGYNALGLGGICNCLLFPTTPGAKRAVPGRAISTLPPRRGGAPTAVLSPARRSAAVRMRRGGTARPPEAEWSSGVAAFWGGLITKIFSKIPKNVITTTLACNIIRVYKGSAWGPAFVGTHAPGRAGQHFDLFNSISDRVETVTTQRIVYACRR